MEEKGKGDLRRAANDAPGYDGTPPSGSFKKNISAVVLTIPGDTLDDDANESI